MIYDQLQNERYYRHVHPGLDLAFDYLLSFDPKTEDGKYELEGDRVFAMVQSYLTKPAVEKRYEAHQRYVDLQYMVSGEEVLYHFPLERLTLADPHNEAKDCAFYHGEDSQALILKPGDFSILFPQDGHKPGCVGNQPGVVKKVVLKIAVA